MTTASMRSWLSETRISAGASRSRSGTRSRSMSRPTRPLAAISLAALVRPAAPRSCSATNAPSAARARQQSISLRSVKGSLTCTDGRLSSSSSSSAEASTLAPPMPSRPVRLPISTSALPGPEPAARSMPSALSTPTHMALTRHDSS